MKQSKSSLSPLAAAAIVVGAAVIREYMRQDPHCDRECQTRWDHLMNHVLPIVLQQWGFQA